jgi:hypothetical protein
VVTVNAIKYDGWAEHRVKRTPLHQFRVSSVLQMFPVIMVHDFILLNKGREQNINHRPFKQNTNYKCFKEKHTEKYLDMAAM